MPSRLRSLTLSAAFIVAVAFAGLLIVAKDAGAYYDPRTYLGSMIFDGTDYSDSGEKLFPVQGSGIWLYSPITKLMNLSRDFNGDNTRDVEDDSEMVIPFKIGTGLTGTTLEYYVINSSYPNDQTPAVYFRRKVLSGTWAGWEVYEYWLYYGANDWFNDHEHEAEAYFVYLYNGAPSYTRISYHGAYGSYAWSTWQQQQLVENNTHLKLSTDGGSHAFKSPGTIEDGVRIKYDGYTTKRGGRLDYGDGMTFPWYIFSNDTNAVPGSVISYSLAPDWYYYDDPWFGDASEWGDARTAIWLRPEFENPPSPY